MLKRVNRSFLDILMIQSIKELKDYISADCKENGMERHYWLKLFYGNEDARAFRYLKTLRKYEYAINTHRLWRYWYRFKLRRLGLKYNVVVGPNMVGKGLRMSHLMGGVIINCISMGDYCTVAGGVVVGNKGSQENRASIGNHVELTLGCKVIGKVRIGDNAIVAPNSVVIKDVPENAVVSGVPAKIIKYNNESSSNK